MASRQPVAAVRVGEDARVTRTRGRHRTHRPWRADHRGLRCPHPRPGRRGRRLLQDDPLQPLAGRIDLFKAALGALGEAKPYELTGDLRTDLIGQLMTFRQSVLDRRLDRVLAAMAQWASGGDESDQGCHQRRGATTDPHHPGGVLRGAELEAVISMLTGVVACPSLMFGTLPDDDVIEAAVDVVVKSVG